MSCSRLYLSHYTFASFSFHFRIFHNIPCLSLSRPFPWPPCSTCPCVSPLSLFSSLPLFFNTSAFVSRPWKRASLSLNLMIPFRWIIFLLLGMRSQSFLSSLSPLFLPLPLLLLSPLLSAPPKPRIAQADDNTAPHPPLSNEAIMCNGNDENIITRHLRYELRAVAMETTDAASRMPDKVTVYIFFIHILSLFPSRVVISLDT